MTRFLSVPLAALALSACASSSIRSDVDRVGELSAARALPAVEGAGDAGEAERARALMREPIDADAAVRIGLLHNRNLRAQLQELGVARGQFVQAGLPANPVLEAEAIPAEPTEVELRVEYNLSSLVLAPLRAGAAEAALDAARFRTAAAVVRLGYEIRAAFLAVQASERRLAIATQALEAFALGREAAEELLRAGNVRELDAVSHAAAHERARVRVAEIELELTKRRERLQRLLGLDADPRRPPLRVQPGPGPAPDALAAVRDVEGVAVARSLELAETRSLWSSAERQARATRTAGWLPDISLGALTVYEERTADEIAFGEDRDPWRLGGGISVTVPLFDRRQGTARAFEAEQARQRELYEGLVLTLRSRARELERMVVSAHGRAKQYERVILPAQQRVLEQTLLQYNAMQVSVFDLLRARREQLEVELAYVETLREYWTAQAALDALLAGVRVAPGEAGSGQAANAPAPADPADGGGH